MRSLFNSTASIAESLRSTCGPARKAPEGCKQLFPIATPHLGHGTDDNCLGVMSFILIDVGCNKTARKAVRKGTQAIVSQREKGWRNSPALFCFVCGPGLLACAWGGG